MSRSFLDMMRALVTKQQAELDIERLQANLEKQKRMAQRSFGGRKLFLRQCFERASMIAGPSTPSPRSLSNDTMRTHGQEFARLPEVHHAALHQEAAELSMQRAQDRRAQIADLEAQCYIAGARWGEAVLPRSPWALQVVACLDSKATGRAQGSTKA